MEVVAIAISIGALAVSAWAATTARRGVRLTHEPQLVAVIERSASFASPTGASGGGGPVYAVRNRGNGAALDVAVEVGDSGLINVGEVGPGKSSQLRQPYRAEVKFLKVSWSSIDGRERTKRLTISDTRR
jgi:hypothetical protein